MRFKILRGTYRNRRKRGGLRFNLSHAHSQLEESAWVGDKIAEKQLTAHQIKIEFMVITDEIIDHLYQRRAYLSRKTKLRALSIPLNIVEDN